MFSADEEFRSFWASYPRRVGKLAAMQAYQKARRIATADEILAGVQAYIRRKPDDRDWCHPTTFLNQGRWMDEDDAPVEKKDTRPSYQPYIRLADRAANGD